MPISLKEYTGKYGTAIRKKTSNDIMTKKRKDAAAKTGSYLSQANAIKSQLDKIGGLYYSNKTNTENGPDITGKRRELSNAYFGLISKVGQSSMGGLFPSFSDVAAVNKAPTDSYNASIAEGQALTDEAVLAEQQRLKKLKMGVAGNITSR